MVKAKSNRAPRQSQPERSRNLDTSQLLFVDDPPEKDPAADKAALEEDLRSAESAAEKARAGAERARLVADSTRAAARTARESVKEAMAAAEHAETEAIEAEDVAEKFSAEAETAESRARELAEKLAALQSPPANRVSAWIEYPKRKEERQPSSVAQPQIVAATTSTPKSSEPPRKKRKKLVVPTGYEIVRQIEDDELGVLCIARQVKMDRLVQLKLLNTEAAGDRELVDRFLREARTAGKFNHPNLMRIHAAGRAGSQYYYSAEHIEGRTLADAVSGNGSFAPGRACQVTRALASGLEQWEKYGLVHGGLNPIRTVESNSGDFKLMGLGLSSRGMDLMADLSPAELSYVAPEMILEDNADSRADVYSLGALLYFLLTGKRPHDADNRGDVVRASREEPTELVGSMRGTPKIVVEVVRKAMRPNPPDRFELVPEMIKALDAAVSGSKIVPAPALLRSSSRRRRR